MFNLHVFQDSRQEKICPVDYECKYCFEGNGNQEYFSYLQSKLYMEGFRSLKEGEPVEFTFKKSSKGLESIRVTGPGGSPCLGSERRPKGKTVQKRKPKGDR